MYGISPRILTKKARIATPEELGVLTHWSHGKTFDRNVIDVSIKLGKREKWVLRTILAYWRYNLIPKSVFAPAKRENKRAVYQHFLNLINKHLDKEVGYIGLASTAWPEIYSSLTQLINSNLESKVVNYFDVIDKNRTTINYLGNIYPIRSLPVGVNIIHGNILNKIPYKYNILDLDFMCQMSNRLIDKVVDNINSATTLTTVNRVLGITTSYGHKLTKKRYLEELRPYLVQRLEEKHNIIEHINGSYCDRRIPMMYEYFALGNKSAGLVDR